MEERCGPLGSRIVSRLWASSGVTRRGWPFAPGIFCVRRKPLSQQVSQAREAREKRRLYTALSSPGDSRSVGGKRRWRSVAQPPALQQDCPGTRSHRCGFAWLSPENHQGWRSHHLLQCCAGLPVKKLFLMDGDAFLRWQFINQLRLPGFPSRTEAGQAELRKALAPRFVALLLRVLPAGCMQQQITPLPDPARLGATGGDCEQAGRYGG